MIENIYLIGGAPRTGKSTVAKELAKKYSIELIYIDNISANKINQTVESSWGLSRHRSLRY